MSSTVHFTVQNNLTKSVNENVLVFLMPVDASPDFQFAAWQSLAISPGGSEPFDYNIDIQVQAQREDNLSTSAKVNINPGELYNVIFSNLDGITLTKDPRGAGVTPDQCGVANKTDGISVKTIWYVNGSVCVAMPGLNEGSTSLFQLEPSLYFRAAAPTDQGLNFTLQQVSAQTKYVLPASAEDVTVTWSRQSPGAPDVFTFDPPSDAVSEQAA